MFTRHIPVIGGIHHIGVLQTARLPKSFQQASNTIVYIIHKRVITGQSPPMFLLLKLHQAEIVHNKSILWMQILRIA